MISKTRSAAVAAILLLGAQGAFAASAAEEAKALMAQGQYSEALKKLDQQLAKNPQDAEARFARGLALTKLNRTPEALKVFTDLTRDYPQLPEPYNNLAVIYAQQGDYEKARDALQAALSIHPSYATAHENLGDIYIALAGAAYHRALKLDPNSAALRNKLTLVAQIEKPFAETLTTPAVAAKPAAAAATPAAAPAAAPAETADADTTAAVNAALQSWSKAWSSQDLPGYFAAYDADFVPEGGLSHSAWEQQRRERIGRPSSIKVTLDNVQTERIKSDRVRASFVQRYESDNYSDSVNKILELRKAGGAWKILREYTR